MIPTVRIGNVAYEVVHSFTASRVLIRYEGLYVLADCSKDGQWDLSGEPATPEEAPIVAKYVRPDEDLTTVTVTR